MENKDIEGVGPVSDIAKQALEELKSEGFEIGEKKEEEAPKEEPKEEAPEEKEEPKEAKEEKIDRKPAQIPAWKAKIEEKRWAKEKEEMETNFKSEISNLQKKVEELSSSKDMTKAEKAEIADEIEELAKEFGLDDANKNLIKKLEKVILGKIKLPEGLTEKVTELEREKEAIKQEKAYNADFASEILPLVKAEHPNISDDKLSEIKSKLMDLAFTEEYSKLSLKKIFRAEYDVFDLKESPKRVSGETGKSGQQRNTGTIDYDKMDESTFAKLTPEEVLEFSKRKSENGWK